MNKTITAPSDAKMMPVSQVKDNRPPASDKKVYLTNKAGAFANPLAKDFDAWAAIGWYRV
jgi:hypothetical protein|tara:strand:+ start:240 stop:419 length:180 start_codon:yes stop_codon:yes gene_type:complete